jgi:hypothetical protein
MIQEKTNTMNQPIPPKPPKKLLDQYRDALRLKQYSARTEKTCTLWVRSYILFHHKRHPKEMGWPEIRQFITHLVSDKFMTKTWRRVMALFTCPLPWNANIRAPAPTGSGSMFFPPPRFSRKPKRALSAGITSINRRRSASSINQPPAKHLPETNTKRGHSTEWSLQFTLAANAPSPPPPSLARPRRQLRRCAFAISITGCKVTIAVLMSSTAPAARAVIALSRCA